MTLEIEEVIQACQVLADQDDLKICIKESAKGAFIAAFFAFIFGLLLGAIGLFIGGATGGSIGASMSKKYKPLGQILKDMTQRDKQKLYNHMMKAIQGLAITDAIILMTIVSDPAHQARKALATELVTYFGAVGAPATN